MANPILTKSRGEAVTSPEQLNDYIKVSNVGVWILLALIFMLLISVLVWGFVGSLNTTVNMTGYAENGKAECYISSADKISAGNTARVNGIDGEVVEISEKPLSKEEIEAKYDAYTAYQLNLSDWNYVVTIEAQDCPDGVQTYTVICDSVRPFSFITG